MSALLKWILPDGKKQPQANVSSGLLDSTPLCIAHRLKKKITFAKFFLSSGNKHLGNSRIGKI